MFFKVVSVSFMKTKYYTVRMCSGPQNKQITSQNNLEVLRPIDVYCRLPETFRQEDRKFLLSNK